MQSHDPMPEKLHAHKATVAQVAGAVFWSFLGIRKKRDYEADAANITALQAIIAGIVGAIILILALLVAVHVITK